MTGEPLDPKLWQMPPGDLDAFLMPRIHDEVPSWCEVPIIYEVEALAGADVAIVGVPFESARFTDNVNVASTGGPPDPDAVYPRGGANKSPDYLRTWSVHNSIRTNGWRWPEMGRDFVVSELLKVVDYQNVDVHPTDSEETARRAIAKIGDIVRAGAVPICLGGDHALPYMSVKAISDNSPGKIGIIWFDSHYDLHWGEGRLNAATQLHRIFKGCDASPENLAQIGINGSDSNENWEFAARAIGSTTFTITDVEDLGIAEVTRRAIEVAGRGTDRIYVSVDVDVLDPVTMPAQKYPHAMGLPARDLKHSLRMIARETNFAGIDVCCIGPDYDFKGLGAMTMNRLLMEVVCGLAWKRWTPAGGDGDAAAAREGVRA